jgi:hypothetical protein
MGMVHDICGSGRHILNVAASPCLHSWLGFIRTYAPATILIITPHVLFSVMDTTLRRRRLIIRGAALVVVISA